MLQSVVYEQCFGLCRLASRGLKQRRIAAEVSKACFFFVVFLLQNPLFIRLKLIIHTYSLHPTIFFIFFFFYVSLILLHYKTFLKSLMSPTTFLLLFSFHTTFTLLSLFYILKINGSHHFTHFSFSFPLSYTYFLTLVPKPNVNNWVGRKEQLL